MPVFDHGFTLEEDFSTLCKLFEQDVVDEDKNKEKYKKVLKNIAEVERFSLEAANDLVWKSVSAIAYFSGNRDEEGKRSDAKTLKSSMKLYDYLKREDYLFIHMASHKINMALMKYGVDVTLALEPSEEYGIIFNQVKEKVDCAVDLINKTAGKGVTSYDKQLTKDENVKTLSNAFNAVKGFYIKGNKKDHRSADQAYDMLKTISKVADKTGVDIKDEMFTKIVKAIKSQPKNI